MFNPYQQYRANIKTKKILTKNACLFTLEFVSNEKQNSFEFIPGQYVLAGFPGFGEAPFDICSSPLNKNKFFQITIRTVGELTQKLNSLKKGDFIFIRGPYGNGFPEFNKDDNLLMIGGGCGVVTFKSFIENEIKNPDMYGEVQLMYGVGHENDLYFSYLHEKWKKYISLNIIVDKPSKAWKGHKGLITDLFDKVKIVKNPKVLMCGPPVMYRFIIEKLKPLNIPEKNIYLALERRMYCGMGICQHCAIGSKYVCKDGPVFSYDELKDKEKYRM